MEDADDISDDGKSLWSNLLQEVKEKSSKTRHIPTSLLVLGNELSGKSSLIARLQKADLKNGVGLEFEFIDVKDESMDENKQLNVWISSGDTFHSNLLKYALDENNFPFTLCMITVSIAEPWSVMESLDQWLDILKKHIDRLKIEPSSLAQFKDTLLRHFQEYVEPEVDITVPVVVGKRRDAGFNHLHPTFADEPDKIFLPLGDGEFDRNLGIPIVVVITKTDQIPTLEQDFQYDDDKFDFIQMNIRKTCLRYGAALCYTSLKDGRNCELLLNYILHRCYGFPFLDTASVIEKDAIFIPTGWDNIKKINILAENLPEDARNQKFDVFISKPLSLVRAATQNRISEPEMPEDEQVFLMKQQAQLQKFKASADPNAKPEPARGTPLPKGTSVAGSGPGRNRKNLSGQSTVGATSSNPGVQGNEGVLANFFSSLLNKRTVPGESSLQSQQSTTDDTGKPMEYISESDKFSKDDSKAEEIPDIIMPIADERKMFSESSPVHLTISETNLQRLDENVAIDIKESKTESTEIVSRNNEKQITQSIEDTERNAEALQSEETEIDDENSTGKQISELEETGEVGERNDEEIMIDEVAIGVSENLVVKELTEELVVECVKNDDIDMKIEDEIDSREGEIHKEGHDLESKVETVSIRNDIDNDIETNGENSTMVKELTEEVIVECVKNDDIEVKIEDETDCKEREIHKEDHDLESEVEAVSNQNDIDNDFETNGENSTIVKADDVIKSDNNFEANDQVIPILNNEDNCTFEKEISSETSKDLENEALVEEVKTSSPVNMSEIDPNDDKKVEINHMYQNEEQIVSNTDEHMDIINDEKQELETVAEIGESLNEISSDVKVDTNNDVVGVDNGKDIEHKREEEIVVEHISLDEIGKVDEEEPVNLPPIDSDKCEANGDGNNEQTVAPEEISDTQDQVNIEETDHKEAISYTSNDNENEAATGDDSGNIKDQTAQT